MAPSHFGSGISPESFGVDGFVRRFSLDAQSFVSFGLAFGTASARVSSPQITRRIGVASTLPFGLIGHNSFSVPIDVRLVFRR